MSHNATTPDLSATAPADAVRETLSTAQESMLRLLASLPRHPATLRVQAGDVTIEATWPTGPSTGASAGDPGAGPAAAPVADGGTATAPPPVDDGRTFVTSPTVGAFYRAPEPGVPPFVEVGDTVVAGQQVAIVETMKLMIPVNADRSGTVAEVLRSNGDSVEHGEALFAIVPTGPAGPAGPAAAPAARPDRPVGQAGPGRADRSALQDLAFEIPQLLGGIEAEMLGEHAPERRVGL